MSAVEWGYRSRLKRLPGTSHPGRRRELASRSRKEAEETVAELLADDGWEAEVIWRTAAVEPGPWHSYRPSVTDVLEKASSAREDGEALTPQVLSDLLSLTEGAAVPPEVIATWTEREREQAAAWAVSEHLHASDHPDVARLVIPPFVARTAEICASPALAQLAVEAWTRHREAIAVHDDPEKPWADNVAAGKAQDAITALLVLLKGAGRPS